MNTHADKASPNQRQVVANVPQSPDVGKQTFQFIDNRPEAIAQRRLLTLIKDQALQQEPRNQHVLQGKFEPIQKKENNTGLPDNLKTGIENLSGIDISDVKVHYNSGKPSQLQAHAYAQGTDIHVAPGQEQHLPHEAWHVVQQKQGRVKPTLQLKGGAYVNDDNGLEREADVMGMRADGHQAQYASQHVLPASQHGSDTIQRKVGFEFQAYNSVTYKKIMPPKASVGSGGAEEVLAAGDADTKAVAAAPAGIAATDEADSSVAEDSGELDKGTIVGQGTGFRVEADGGATINEMEIVTVPVEETEAGLQELMGQMQLIQQLTGGIEHNGVVKDLKEGGVNWILSVIDGYRFHVNGSVHFHPQATVGVKFGNIADLIDALASAPFVSGGKTDEEVEKAKAVIAKEEVMDRKDGDNSNSKGDKKAELLRTIGWSGQADQRPFKVPWKTGVQNARSDLKGASPSTIGLASLLYGFAEYARYINSLGDKKDKDSKMPKDRSYVKYFMPFMLRLGFGPHFNSLSDDEKKRFGDIPAELLKTPFVPEPGTVGKDDGNMDIPSLTVGSIHKNLMEEGEDIFGDEGIAGHGLYMHDHKAKLGMKSNTDIGASETEEERKGAIIELRKLGNDVTPGQLGAFAAAVFNLVRLVHTPAPPVATGAAAASDAKTVPPPAAQSAAALPPPATGTALVADAKTVPPAAIRPALPPPPSPADMAALEQMFQADEDVSGTDEPLNEPADQGVPASAAATESALEQT